MSVTHVVSQAYSVGGMTVSKTVQVTGESGQEVSIALQAAGETDKLFVEPTIDVSELKSLAVFSDVDCTLETNSDSAADDTLTITAGIPLIWVEDSGIACPLTADVTKWYVNSDPIVGGGTLRIFNVQDTSS